MSLKNHKRLPWVCCIFAALFLSCGLMIPEINSRSAAEWIEETSAAASFSIDFDEGTFFETEVFPEDSFNTEFSEENIFSENDTDIEENAISDPQEIIPGFFSPVLLLAGTVLGILSVFLMKMKHPYAGPEPELFLISFCIYFLFQKPDFVSDFMIFPSEDYYYSFFSTAVLFRLIYFWVLFVIILVLTGGFCSWMGKGFPLSWSTGHRLGLLITGNSGKQGPYLMLQFVWSIVSLMACILLAGSIQQNEKMLLPGAGCAACGLAAVLSVCCFRKVARDVDHLSEQICHLYEGNPVSVHDGTFKEDEEKLLDLIRQRDEAVHTAVVSERFKVDLISNVSHDLRTPLTAILGYGELLKKENLSPDGAKQLGELNRKAGYMRDLVESLFELTKVSSGAVECKKEKIDLIRLLEQTLGLFDDQLSGRNLQIRRHYEMESLPIITDGARMHQVFANLLGNAIKYTLPGTRIHLEVKKDDREYVIRMVNIASYEMDFDPEEIVQRFARGDKARTTKGSGLGLAIAQTYTESVGGTFKVVIDGEQFSAIVMLPVAEEYLSED